MRGCSWITLDYVPFWCPLPRDRSLHALGDTGGIFCWHRWAERQYPSQDLDKACWAAFHCGVQGDKCESQQLMNELAPLQAQLSPATVFRKKSFLQNLFSVCLSKKTPNNQTRPHLRPTAPHPGNWTSAPTPRGNNLRWTPQLGHELEAKMTMKANLITCTYYLVRCNSLSMKSLSGGKVFSPGKPQQKASFLDMLWLFDSAVNMLPHYSQERKMMLVSGHFQRLSSRATCVPNM